MKANLAIIKSTINDAICAGVQAKDKQGKISEVQLNNLTNEFTDILMKNITFTSYGRR